MKPEQFLKQTKQFEKNLEQLSKKHVAVGLPKEKVGGQIYGDGETVFTVGASHEYGVGVPRRSFLRAPFSKNQDAINKTTENQFRAIAEQGVKVEKALNIIGVKARNISAKAFVTGGYGEWKPLSAATIEKKGSSQPLIDTGTLRNSITWAVRND
jgi:hypothetical protein